MRILLLAFILCCSGCVSTAVDKITDNHGNELTTKAFYSGAAVGGLPVVAAAAPITLSLAYLEGWGQYTSLIILAPGYPTGAVVGFTVSLPFYCVQSFYRKIFQDDDKKKDEQKQTWCTRCHKLFPCKEDNLPLLCPDCERAKK